MEKENLQFRVQGSGLGLIEGLYPLTSPAAWKLPLSSHNMDLMGITYGVFVILYWFDRL